MLPDEYPVSLVIKVDLPNESAVDLFEENLHDLIKLGRVDGFYFLTRNQQPVRHQDAHLGPENRLGRAISAVQTGKIFVAEVPENNH